MDPESLKRQKIKEREQLRQEILKELKQDYYLTPKTKKLEITEKEEDYYNNHLDSTINILAHF